MAWYRLGTQKYLLQERREGGEKKEDMKEEKEGRKGEKGKM